MPYTANMAEDERQQRIAELKRRIAEVRQRIDALRQRQTAMAAPATPLIDVGPGPTQEMPAPYPSPSEVPYQERGLGQYLYRLGEKVFPFETQEPGWSKRARSVGAPEISHPMGGKFGAELAGGAGRTLFGIAGWHADLVSDPTKALNDMAQMVKTGAVKWQDLYKAFKGDEELRKRFLYELKNQPVELIGELGIPLLIARGIGKSMAGRLGVIPTPGGEWAAPRPREISVPKELTPEVIGEAIQAKAPKLMKVPAEKVIASHRELFERMPIEALEEEALSPRSGNMLRTYRYEHLGTDRFDLANSTDIVRYRQHLIDYGLKNERLKQFSQSYWTMLEERFPKTKEPVPEMIGEAQPKAFKETPQEVNPYQHMREQQTKVFEWEMEGQTILDGLEAADVDLAQLHKTFWDKVYPNLPHPVQMRFQRLVEGQLGEGIRPGETWGGIAQKFIDLDKVRNLEGTQRGYVALMAEALRRFQAGEFAKRGAQEVPPSPTAAELPTAIEAPISPGKPVNVHQINSYFTRNLETPIRFGRIKQRFKGRAAAGMYDAGLIRTKAAYDIPTGVHEIAHRIWEKFGLRQKFGKAKELQNLAYEGAKDKIEEGFAEFLRHWATTGEETQLAPGFSRTWEQYLATEPKLKQTLEGGRELIRRYQQQGATERMWQHLDMSGKMTKPHWQQRMGELGRVLRDRWWDSFGTLEWTEKKMRGGIRPSDPLKVDPATSPTQLARADNKAAAAKAQEMITGSGTFDFAGQRTGPSLREVLDPLKTPEQQKGFLTYAYARRALDLHERGIEVYPDIADAQYAARQLDNPMYDQVLNGVTDWENRVMDYVVDSGHLSREAADAIKALNPVHIPLKTVFEDAWAQRSGAGGGGAGAQIFSPKTGYKRIRGSLRPKQNPWVSMIENTTQLIEIADKARIANRLVDLAEQSPLGKRWVVEIAPDKMAVSQTFKDAIRSNDKLREWLGDVFEEGLPQEVGEELVTLYNNKPNYFGKENIVTTFRDGQRRWFELDPELYKCVQAIGKPSRNVILQMMAAPARAVRLGATGLQPGFSWITNPVRDAFGYAMQTEFGRAWSGATAQARGLKLRFGKDTQLWDLYARSGNDMSTLIGLDKKLLKRGAREIFLNSEKAKALNLVRHPIEVAKNIFSFTESATRMAEFEKTYKALEQQYGPGSASARIGAARAAADVTIDFRRMGQYGSIINDIVPFWNAGVQGLAKMNRFFMESPKKAVTRGLTMITAPTVALWYLHKDEPWYQDLPAYQKMLFWNFKVGDTVFRIPRPFEWGVLFGSIPEAFLNYWYTENPEELNQSLGTMYDVMSPIPMPQDVAMIGPYIETTANYDYFRDRHIISPWLEGLPKQLQYRSDTPQAYRWLGKQLGYFSDDLLSPAQIGHLMDGYTGGLAGDIVGLFEQGGGWLNPEYKSDYAIIGRLMSRVRTEEEKQRSVEWKRKQEVQKYKAWLKQYNATQDERYLEKAQDIVHLWQHLHPGVPFMPKK